MYQPANAAPSRPFAPLGKTRLPCWLIKSQRELVPVQSSRVMEVPFFLTKVLLEIQGEEIPGRTYAHCILLVSAVLHSARITDVMTCWDPHPNINGNRCVKMTGYFCRHETRSTLPTVVSSCSQHRFTCRNLPRLYLPTASATSLHKISTWPVIPSQRHMRTLDDIVGAGACTPCRGRITKVCAFDLCASTGQY
jgi:hypothetical protein